MDQEAKEKLIEELKRKASVKREKTTMSVLIEKHSEEWQRMLVREVLKKKE